MRKGKVIPFRRKPQMVALVCPKCGDVRYFPKGEEYYTDEQGRRLLRRCAKCPS